MHPAYRALALLVCLAGGIAAAGPDAGTERLRVLDAAESCAELDQQLAPVAGREVACHIRSGSVTRVGQPSGG